MYSTPIQKHERLNQKQKFQKEGGKKKKEKLTLDWIWLVSASSLLSLCSGSSTRTKIELEERSHFLEFLQDKSQWSENELETERRETREGGERTPGAVLSIFYIL
jgi:hypothetical protein